MMIKRDLHHAVDLSLAHWPHMDLDEVFPITVSLFVKIIQLAKYYLPSISIDSDSGLIINC